MNHHYVYRNGTNGRKTTEEEDEDIQRTRWVDAVDRDENNGGTGQERRRMTADMVTNHQ